MNPSILLVDDDSSILGVIQEHLKKNGLENTHTSSSLEEARKRAATEHFDVIVTDMIMESEDAGYRLEKYFRELSPLVIVLTAFPNETTLKNCMRSGAYDYINKSDNEAYKQLVRSIKEGLPLNKEKKRVVDRDARYITENLDDLIERHPGVYVAVLDERVVGHGKDYEALEKQMDERYPYCDVTLFYLPGKGERVA